MEAHRLAVVGGDEDKLLPVRLLHTDELVALVQGQGADSALADVLQLVHRQPLHSAAAGGHKEVQGLILHLPEVEHSLDLLPVLHLNDIDHVDALGGFAALGNLIALLAVDLAGVGEKEDIVMGGCGEHRHHLVLLPGGHTLLAHAALALGGVLADGGALNVPGLGEGKDALLLLDQVLDIYLVLHILDSVLRSSPNFSARADSSSLRICRTRASSDSTRRK